MKKFLLVTLFIFQACLIPSYIQGQQLQSTSGSIVIEAVSPSPSVPITGIQIVPFSSAGGQFESGTASSTTLGFPPGGLAFQPEVLTSRDQLIQLSYNINFMPKDDLGAYAGVFWTQDPNGDLIHLLERPFPATVAHASSNSLYPYLGSVQTIQLSNHPLIDLTKPLVFYVVMDAGFHTLELTGFNSFQIGTDFTPAQ